MADPVFSSLDEETTEDLPRTFRREKAARAREARERAARERAMDPPSLNSDSSSGDMPDVGPAVMSNSVESSIHDMPFPASVRRFDVPFVHLMVFFLKAVIAAIPALVLLGVILWFGGQLLESVFPELVKAKILITFPN